MSLPRVLLVEDDASIRRLVELSLDGLPIELILAPNASEARARLREGPVQLLITDLMMPGESGIELLQSLSNDAALRAEARLVVFSAGVTPAIHDALVALGVWRFLSKPVSIEALESCVVDGLGLASDGGSQGAEPARVSDATDDDKAPARPDVIAAHFAGDAALYEAFRATCVLQFGQDRLDGEQAVSSRDAPPLRRLAHSLKSVLRTLGETDAADDAAQLEVAAAAADWPAAEGAWRRLRSALQHLAREPRADQAAS